MNTTNIRALRIKQPATLPPSTPNLAADFVKWHTADTEGWREDWRTFDTPYRRLL